MGEKVNRERGCRTRIPKQLGFFSCTKHEQRVEKMKCDLEVEVGTVHEEHVPSSRG